MALLISKSSVDTEMIMAFSAAPSDTIQADKSKVAMQSVDTRLKLWQSLASIGFSLAFGITGAAIGSNFNSGDGGSPYDIGYAPKGFAVGYLVGSSTGVYLVGKNKTDEGSYWATFAGSVFGLAAGVGIMALSPDDLWPAILIMPHVGSMVGYHLSIR